MGSFANSLHVMSSSEEAVAVGIAELLKSEGWRPTDKVPGQSLTGRFKSSPRGLQVSATAGGWVSILDSDIGGPQSLVPALAEQLGTYAIFVYVNDSDSWGYLLAHPDGTTNEFDSAESEGDDLDGGDLAASSAALAKVQALMQGGSFYQRMQQIQDQMAADAPPEVRAALERMRSGQMTPADIQQYQAWAMQQMPKYMEDVKSLLGGALGTPVSPKPARKRRASKGQQKAQQ